MGAGGSVPENVDERCLCHTCFDTTYRAYAADAAAAAQSAPAQSALPPANCTIHYRPSSLAAWLEHWRVLDEVHPVLQRLCVVEPDELLKLPPSERRRIAEQVPPAARERWALAVQHIEHIHDTPEHPASAHPTQSEPPPQCVTEPPPMQRARQEPEPEPERERERAAAARPFDLGGLTLWLEQWRLMRLMPRLQVSAKEKEKEKEKEGPTGTARHAPLTSCHTSRA